MKREEKELSIASLKALFAQTEAVILADTSGVDVNSINILRSKFRAEGITFKVVKNTLAKRALAGSSMAALAASFVGPTAIATKPGDPVTPAKIVVEFAKDSKAFEIKGGFISGSLLNAAGVDQLSKMKNRNELRSEFLSLLKAPQSRFVGVCNTMVTQFVSLLNARAEDLEG
ncbi:MAG: 50S ribosomal protein L10 [Deltaproteobacteria bacterium CG2_30_63_29]|nr:MAG: 50S ribosomal protein L10 [Deltaproteobacteria bacterium CG2_30_63_29]PIV99249.1 MAG: 50S ribosomal protein L10 [Deltaproteobacteria bacterium CG17_big_fil_post_rev_8_21_14_2_50_63_7]PJB37918.1 MAG: 50S ribosomal protein L10 [Deltaproteobacteria bacterium CG_4_9_14_3_um_filter_63_12]